MKKLKWIYCEADSQWLVENEFWWKITAVYSKEAKYLLTSLTGVELFFKNLSTAKEVARLIQYG